METPSEVAARLARSLDWNLLRTFVAIVDAGGVTRAAEALGLQQPTISNALRRLEETLGRRLIDRGLGRFEVTEAGRLLHREAVDIQGAILRLGVLMRDLTEQVTGHVRIAMASHVVCPLFDQVLADFREAHPLASLALDVTGSHGAVDDTVAQRASVAICLVRKRHPKLQYTQMYREYFGLYCGPTHPLFGRMRRGATDLSGCDWVSFTTDQMNDVLRPVALLRARAAPDDRIVATSTHLEEVRRMIIAGLGIGPLPLHVARRDERDGLLWRLPPLTDPPALDVYVAHNPGSRRNRAEAALLQLLLGSIAAIPIAERTYVT
jgi:DNA-binding transcriptional LysR family regulator